MSSNKLKSVSKVQETSMGTLAQNTIRHEDFPLLQSLEGELFAIFSRSRLAHLPPQPTAVLMESGSTSTHLAH